MGPLHGLKVIELAGIGPGPMAAMLLADMGATVLRVDRKEPASLGVPRPLKYDLLLRNRRSLPLDLKQAAAIELVLDMVSSSDVLIEGFRPGVTERMGLGPEACLARNPRLIYGRITGWGQSGPMAQEVGHDLNYIAYAGMLAQNTDETGRPVIPNLQVGDLLGGALSAVQGILAALLAVKMGGPGRFIDVSMTDAVFAHHIMPLLAKNYDGQSPPPARDLLTGGVPCYGVYRCSDGRYMAVGALELKFWERCCDLLQRPDLKTQHWSLGQAVGDDKAIAVKVELEKIFSSRTQSEWTAIFETADCCVTPVLTTEEAMAHPHFSERGMTVRISHETEGDCTFAAPAVKFSD